MGQSAFFEKPSGCSYIRLFINDDPKGIDDEGDKETAQCSIPLNSDGKARYPGIFGSRGQIFVLNESENFINNSKETGCTKLDESFTITFSLLAPTEAQLDAGLKFVTDEALTKLFGGLDSKGVVSIAANPNAETIAINKFNEVLDVNGSALSPNVREILHRYVVSWISNEKMKYQRDQLNTELALLEIDKASYVTTESRLDSQKLLLEDISIYKDDQEVLNTMRLAYAKKLRDTYQLFLRDDLIEINQFLHLYLDSLVYHQPTTSVEAVERFKPHLAKIESLISQQLIQEVSPSECENIEKIEKLPGATVDLVNEICGLEEIYNENLLAQELQAHLDAFTANADLRTHLLDNIVGEKIESCSLEVFKNDDIEVQTNPVASTGSGTWGATPNNPPTTTVKKRLETNFIPLEIVVNSNSGEKIINPDFDDEEACKSYSEGAEFVACMTNLQAYRKKCCRS